VNLSSDRKSIVISSNPKNYNDSNYYMPETLSEIYARMGYKAYTNGEFEKSIKYFNEMFKLDKSNASAYLYASYASEALYKKTGKKAYFDDAKVYAESAKTLDPQNKYVLEQIDAL
jgi:tetratricopeptide (TPR) repeat protein